MSAQVYVLNGPNLNMLGKREPDIYGRDTLADIEKKCLKKAEKLRLSLRFLQSNHEGELVQWIQEAVEKGAKAILINPAAYSHTSVAILDALKIFGGVVAEVHLSNVHQREAFRHHSYVSARADAVIAGCGALGYVLALDYIAAKLGGGK